MAPLFEAAGFAPFFQCKFRLKAFDDGKLRCYADTATGTLEVVARFHGLTMEQFNSLFSCIKQLQKSENHSSNTAVSLAAFQSAFDGCFEQALGRRPPRKAAALEQQHAAATSNPKADPRHSHSPPSPSSKQPPKRVSLRLQPRSEIIPPSSPAPIQEAADAFHHASAGAQELSFGAHVVWLQCNDDRCK